LTGPQQVAFEMSVERRVDLFAGFGHLVFSLQDAFVNNEGGALLNGVAPPATHIKD
jgi:hypothetical protein